MPKYDSTNFPQDSVEGQLATVSPNALWAVIDGVWVPINSLMPWVFTSTDITGFTAIDGILQNNFITHNGLECAPLNFGGSVDDTVFGWGIGDPPIVGIPVLSGGLYFASGLVAWFEDWGTAFVTTEWSSTGPTGGGRTPVLEIMGSYNTQDMRAPQAAYLSAHQQILLRYWGVWSVDPDAEGVQVKLNIHNVSGSNKTYASASPNPNIANLTIIRLSPSGASNP